MGYRSLTRAEKRQIRRATRRTDPLKSALKYSMGLQEVRRVFGVDVRIMGR